MPEHPHTAKHQPRGASKCLYGKADAVFVRQSAAPLKAVRLVQVLRGPESRSGGTESARCCGLEGTAPCLHQLGISSCVRWVGKFQFRDSGFGGNISRAECSLLFLLAAIRAVSSQVYVFLLLCDVPVLVHRSFGLMGCGQVSSKCQMDRYDVVSCLGIHQVHRENVDMAECSAR